MNSGYISELQDGIRRLHGVESKYVESVPIKETFQGKTVWEGIVEVFELVGHPKALSLRMAQITPMTLSQKSRKAARLS